MMVAPKGAIRSEPKKTGLVLGWKDVAEIVEFKSIALASAEDIGSMVFHVGCLPLSEGDPPPLKWSAAMFRKRRIHDGK